MKKRKAKKGTAKAAKQPAATQPEKDSDHMDFGGLPTRDLKKNLGCG